MTLKSVNNDFLSHLRSALPRAVFGPLSAKYLEEPRKRFFGSGGLLLKPGNTAEVSAVVKAANKFEVGIVPYGGGTGLVGGQVKPDDPEPVILSLERMNSVREVLPDENILTAEAGAVLASVQEAAENVDRLFPLSLASEGSCQIGGNLATNAGGVQVLKYGNARDLCLGIEAVLPDGTVCNGLSRLRKDNTGYDLRNLLIGSEGSLGVICAASLKLFARPRSQSAALVAVKSPAAALELLNRAQDRFGGMLSAFELMHRQGLDFLAETMAQIKQPFQDQPEWVVLLDVGSEIGSDLKGAVEDLLSRALESGLISDALLAQNDAQRQSFWMLRESIPEANRLIGSIYSHDISVPIGRIAEFIAKGDEIAATYKDLRINCFGHLGDGNLHYNFFPARGRSREGYDGIREQLKSEVYSLVTELGGSISAEHGIGRLKLDDFVTYGNGAKIQAMQKIKAALDPNGIMNPGAVVPPRTKTPRPG